MNLIDRDLISYDNKKIMKNGQIHYHRFADKDDVDRLPVIDARPERYCYIARVDDVSFKCMECGQKFSYGRSVESTGFRYCPHCGAKVKEEIG